MSCTFENNNAVLDKVREKGFSDDTMDYSYQLECECGASIVMNKFETKCENCSGVFVVTPCSQSSVENIVFVK